MTSRNPPAPHRTVGRRSDRSTPPSSRRHPAVELRLAIAKDGLGIELGAPARLGSLVLTELAVNLPAVRFPVDVSGGVQRFRHRRGVLERVTVELSADTLARDLAPKLRGLLGERTPWIWVAVRPWGGTLGVVDDEQGRALAFEVAVDAFEDEVRLTVFGARGLGLHRPAVTLAAEALGALVGRAAKRDGVRFVIDAAPRRVVQAVLPEAGARVPETTGMRIVAVTCASDAWIVHASRGIAAEPTPEAVRAREAAVLLREADEARLAGDLDRARVLDLYCLERAPRHPEVCRRIADLDRLATGRAEAARAILSDSDDPAFCAPLAGELALEARDASGAASALLAASEEEIVPALAAMALERGAQVAPDSLEGLVWLDRAVARAPTLARLHWSRAAARLALGRPRDAIADVEEIEAGVRGASAKHAVWRRAAALWTTAGHAAEARALFERALRFMPDDPQALAGLGASMLAQGKTARGVALLSRALQQAERARLPSATMSAHSLALARALADQLGDKPAAVARVRTIGSADPDAIAARGLEGRWRASLGDKPGASLAYAQMRDLCAASGELARPDEARKMLLEAAAFERRARADEAAAQAHLAVALRLFPRDLAVAEAYREAFESLAAPRTVPPEAPSEDEATDSVRAEELLTKYRGSPSDDALVDELATLLMRLGRSHEVLALLTARYDEAPPAKRSALAEFQVEVLARLEREARARGHDNEAQIFRDAIAAMGGSIEP